MTTLPETDLLDRVELETGPNPAYSVIWLHGLGADANDFVPLIPELHLPASPAIRFVFPNAPIQAVTINGGMKMRSWYDILASDLVRREDAAGIQRSERAIHALIARENARGIDTSRIVLAGFSQGCAMILHTGLRLQHKLAGMIGLSGYLPLADKAQSEHVQTNLGTPIFLAHGTFDPMVALPRAQATLAALQGLGYDVQWHTYPMPHSVCAEEVADIAAFLRKIAV
jgi:phospholipase/carboxylesterase